MRCDLVGDGLDRLEPPGGGIAARVARVEPVHVGEEHEQVGVDQVRPRGRPRLSLSPTLISSTATVSFSLTIGSTPKLSSASSVLRAFR